MDAIKKKMVKLRETLSEAEEKADNAEKDLKAANERAANVSRFSMLPDHDVNWYSTSFSTLLVHEPFFPGFLVIEELD